MAIVPAEAALAFAFGGGIALFFSPCSVALLPAYIAYYAGREDETGTAEPSGPGAPPAFVRGLALIFAGAAIAVGSAVAAVLIRDLSVGLLILLVAAGGAIAATGAALASWGAASLPAGDRSTLVRSARRGAWVGGWTSAGILATFVALGLPFVALGSVAAAAASRWLPFAGFATALGLAGLGAAMALGRKVPSILPSFTAPRSRTVRSFFVFGVGYGLVSTGCFLPVFVNVVSLLVVLDALTATAVVLVFAGAVAGMMLFTSVYVATARSAAVRYLRATVPHAHRAAGVLILAMALFVLWFDWTYVLSFELSRI